MRAKASAWPQRKDGKLTGYTLYEDGSVQVASFWVEKHRKLAVEFQGLEQLSVLHHSYMEKRLVELEQQKNKAWEEMLDDLNVKQGNDRYTINMDTGIVSKLPKDCK